MKKEINKKQQQKEAIKKAAVGFNKIPKPKKNNLPFSLIAAALLGAGIKSETNNGKGFMLNENGVFASEEVIPFICELFKSHGENLYDLIDKKFTPEMIKVLGDVCMSVSERQAEISMKKMEKELELKEREFQLEIKRYEFEKKKKEEV